MDAFFSAELRAGYCLPFSLLPASGPFAPLSPERSSCSSWGPAQLQDAGWAPDFPPLTSKFSASSSIHCSCHPLDCEPLSVLGLCPPASLMLQLHNGPQAWLHVFLPGKLWNILGAQTHLSHPGPVESGGSQT